MLITRYDLSAFVSDKSIIILYAMRGYKHWHRSENDLINFHETLLKKQ